MSSFRNAHVPRIFSLQKCQLTVTLGFIFFIRFNEAACNWASTHSSVFWLSLIGSFVLLIVMVCCEHVRRQSPTNYIVLGLFTMAESYLVADGTINYQADDVLLAVGITAGVCLALSLFSFQTKWDFTMLNGILFVALLLLFLFGIVAVMFPSKRMTLVYSSMGCVLFSMYLIHDTQLMMGGKHKHSISPEEYVFAALNLYVDILDIFRSVLSVIGASKD